MQPPTIPASYRKPLAILGALAVVGAALTWATREWLTPASRGPGRDPASGRFVSPEQQRG